MAGIVMSPKREGLVANIWNSAGERSDGQGLVSGIRVCKFAPQICDAKTVKETAGYVKYIRRCGRTGAARPPSYPIAHGVPSE